jgi:hypothetical protein
MNGSRQFVGSFGFAAHHRKVPTMGGQWWAGSNDPRRSNAVLCQVIAKTQ